MGTEIIIKEAKGGKDDIKVVQKGQLIETINKANQVIHYIDLSYTKDGIFMQGWVGFRTVGQLKEILSEHFLTFFQQYKCKKVFVDATKMTGSFADANEWMATVYMPKLISMGLRNVATVLPQNVFAQMAAEEWNQKMTGFESRTYGSVADALNWLKTV